MTRKGLTTGLLTILSTLAFSIQALAANIQPVSNDATGASVIAQAMVADPSILDAADFISVPPSGNPHGVSDSLSFFPTTGETFGILRQGT